MLFKSTLTDIYLVDLSAYTNVFIFSKPFCFISWNLYFFFHQIKSTCLSPKGELNLRKHPFYWYKFPTGNTEPAVSLDQDILYRIQFKTGLFADHHHSKIPFHNPACDFHRDEIHFHQHDFGFQDYERSINKPDVDFYADEIAFYCNETGFHRNERNHHYHFNFIHSAWMLIIKDD